MIQNIYAVINEGEDFEHCLVSTLSSNIVNLVRTRKRRQAVISLANPMKLNKTKTSFFVGQSEKMLESMECCKVSLFCPWINRKCLGSDRVFIAPISHPEDVH